MDSSLLIAALLSWLAAAGLRLAPDRPGLARLVVPLVSLGVALDAVALADHGVRLGQLPVYDPASSLLFLALLVACGTLYAHRATSGRGLSLFLLPLAVVLLAVALLLPGEFEPASTAEWSVLFPLHVLALLCGLAAFGLSFGVSVVYLVVARRLKQKRLASLGRLPSLTVLDQLNTRFILFGFAALTSGIAAGGIWATSLTGPRDLGATVWSTLVVWAWYFVAVQVRVVGGWRGRLAAGFSVVGFAGLVVGLIGLGVAMGWHG